MEMVWHCTLVSFVKPQIHASAIHVMMVNANRNQLRNVMELTTNLNVNVMLVIQGPIAK